LTRPGRNIEQPGKDRAQNGDEKGRELCTEIDTAKRIT